MSAFTYIKQALQVAAAAELRDEHDLVLALKARPDVDHAVVVAQYLHHLHLALDLVQRPLLAQLAPDLGKHLDGHLLAGLEVYAQVHLVVGEGAGPAGRGQGEAEPGAGRKQTVGARQWRTARCSLEAASRAAA